MKNFAKTLAVIVAFLAVITGIWYAMDIANNARVNAQIRDAERKERVLAVYKMEVLKDMISRKLEAYLTLIYRLRARSVPELHEIGMIALGEMHFELQKKANPEEAWPNLETLSEVNDTLNNVLVRLAAFYVAIPPRNPDPEKDLDLTPAQIGWAKALAEKGGEQTRKEALVFLNGLYQRDLGKEQAALDLASFASVPADQHDRLLRATLSVWAPWNRTAKN